MRSKIKALFYGKPFAFSRKAAELRSLIGGPMSIQNKARPSRIEWTLLELKRVCVRRALSMLK
jgi:hypothetical protein